MELVAFESIVRAGRVGVGGGGDVNQNSWFSKERSKNLIIHNNNNLS